MSARLTCVAGSLTLVLGCALVGTGFDIFPTRVRAAEPHNDSSPIPLPDWFRQLDTDGDGQIGLYEWRASGRPLDEFQRLDRNQDGFLTADEVRYSLAQAAGRLALGTDPATARSNRTPREQPATAPGPTRRDPRPSPRGLGMPQFDSNPGSTSSGSNGSPPAPPKQPVDPSPPPLAAIPYPVNDGTREYWALRELQNEARIRQGPAPVVFLGDSITDDFGHRQGRPIWRLTFGRMGAANLAVSGITTSQVLWQVQTGQVAALSPEVVVILIGTNNLGLGQSPADTATGIAAIVNQLGEQLPDTRILLLGLLPRGEDPNNPFRDAIARVNRRIARLADGQRVQFLNFGPSYLEPDGTIAPALMPDFLHPSQEGFKVYAAAIWEPLIAALRGG
jgi:lysophospholipase L1-like esterase